MKTINIAFDDEEIQELKKHKKTMSWKQYILVLHNKYKETEEN